MGVRRSSNVVETAAREAGFAAGRRLGERVRREDGRRSPATVLRRALTEQGYEPTPLDDTRVIRLRNCPFHALVDEHRTLVCGMNLAMAEGLSEAIGKGLPYRPVLDPQAGMCCVAVVPITRRAAAACATDRGRAARDSSAPRSLGCDSRRLSPMHRLASLTKLAARWPSCVPATDPSASLSAKRLRGAIPPIHRRRAQSSDDRPRGFQCAVVW